MGLRDLFAVMTDEEFASAVDGVQKGNHWWPFVVEVVTMQENLETALMHALRVCADLSEAHKCACKNRTLAVIAIETMLRHAWELRNEISYAALLLKGAE